MRVVTAAQMRAIDAAAVGRDGEIALMRSAGEAIATLIERYARDGPIVGVAGDGNNGGDVYAALAARDRSRKRIVYGDVTVRGSAARTDAMERARAAGVELRPPAVDPQLLAGAGLVLDGILGVNARLPLDPVSAASVVAIRSSGVPVLAVDVPTGLDPTTGAADEATAVRAVATIALGAPKLGCFLGLGPAHSGELWCAELGMQLDDGAQPGHNAFVLTEPEFTALLPVRGAESDKRSAGAPLIVAGSRQFPGAAVLAARGAARAGAGYVTIATPEAATGALRAHLIEQVVVAYDDADPAAAVATILDLTNHCGAIGIGPGMGLSETTGRIVREVIERTSLPLAIDAGALFHLSRHLELLDGKHAVLTPHAGEFARLSGKGTLAPADRWTRLRAFVAEHGVVTLLKGNTTLIADRDAVHLNPTGSPALATAGTGDVLTGMIATLLAQGLSPVDAARTGAYWHGRAGRLAAQARTVGVIAGDVPERLGEAARPLPHSPGPCRIV